jgi:hypothetical protein
MTIMTDSKTVKLTVQEAINEADVGRNIALIPWRVIDSLNLSGGNATGIDADAPCAIRMTGTGSPGCLPDSFLIGKLFDRKRRYYELPVADCEQREKSPP